MKYVALLRGIGPGNPNMRNDKLRGVFEKLGYSNVQSVISSGNVVFGSSRTDVANMESELEDAWQAELGFASTTIIRSQAQLEELLVINPFMGITHGPSSYTLVTFFKKSTEVPFTLPYRPEGKTYKPTGATKTELFSLTDNTTVKTTDLMTWLEKQFSKQISSRTWLTVERIVKKMTH